MVCFLAFINRLLYIFNEEVKLPGPIFVAFHRTRSRIEDNFQLL